MEKWKLLLLLVFTLNGVGKLYATESDSITGSSCAIKLYYDSINSKYCLEPANENHGKWVYIRMGNTNDRTTYIYTDCDTIFIENALRKDTVKVKGEYKFYSLCGLYTRDKKQRSDVMAGYVVGDTTTQTMQNKGQSMRLLTVQNNKPRKNYIIKKKNCYIDSLSIKLGETENDTTLLSLIIRPMHSNNSEKIKKSITVRIEVSRYEKKDTIYMLKSKLNENTILFDTLTISPLDTIKSIVLTKKLKDCLKIDNCSNDSNVQIQVSIKEKKEIVDDIAFESKFTVTPQTTFNERFKESSTAEIKLNGIIFTEQGVSKCVMVLPLRIESHKNTFRILSIIGTCVIISVLLLLLSLLFKSKKQSQVISPSSNFKCLFKYKKRGPIEDELEKLKTQLKTAQKEAKTAKEEAEKVKKEAEKTQTEAEQLKQEAQSQRNEVENIKKEALEKQANSLQIKFDNEKKALNDQHQRDLSQKDDELAKATQENQKLKEENNELNSKVNIGREQLYKQVMYFMDEAAKLCDELENNLIPVIAADDIYKDTIQRIKLDQGAMKSKIERLDKENMDLDQLRENIRNIAINHTKQLGWISVVAKLNSYGKLPEINKVFRERGLETYRLEYIWGTITAMLGCVDVVLIIPAVLSSKFEEEYYQFNNEDVWINQFCQDISIYDYKGFLLDIYEVGYKISGLEIKKPIVYYL